MNEPGKSKEIGFDYAGPSLHKRLSGRSGHLLKSAAIAPQDPARTVRTAENTAEIAADPPERAAAAELR